MLRFVQFVLLMLGLAVVALTSAIVTMRLVIHGAEVKVPDLQGMTAPEALSRTASVGVELTVDNHFYSAEVPAGRILSQSPAAGTVVRREWHVRCIESLGPQTVAIPQLVGLPQRSAVIELRRLGLEVGAIARMPDPGTQPDRVIAQDPPAGAAGVERPSVALLVSDSTQNSDGPAGGSELLSSYVMPDFTGRPYAAASTLLARAGLKLGPEINYPLGTFFAGQSASGPVIAVSGTVIAQTPSAGSRIDPEVAVQLTVVR